MSRGTGTLRSRRNTFGEARSMRPVGRGNRGKQVVDIQTRLAALGYFLGDEGRRRVLRTPHRERHPGVSAAAAALRRRDRRRQHLDRAGRGRLPAGRSACSTCACLTCAATTCSICNAGSTSSASIAGPSTASSRPLLEVAVTEFQRNAGLNVDGIVGETTLDRLRRLQKVGDDGRGGQHPRPHGRLRGTAALCPACG